MRNDELKGILDPEQKLVVEFMLSSTYCERGLVKRLISALQLQTAKWIDNRQKIMPKAGTPHVNVHQ